MSANSKAKTPRGSNEILYEHGQKITELYSLLRIAQGPRDGGFDTGGLSTPGPQTGGNFVKRSGDTMQGPLAFTPKIADVVNNAIDVSEATAESFSGRLIVANPAGQDLINIIGAKHAGQQLEIQGVETESWTIKHTPGSLSGIRSNTGADIQVNGNQVFLLTFDSMSNQWVVKAGFVGSSGGVGTDLWSGITIDTEKDMLGFGLDDLGMIKLYDEGVLTANRFGMVARDTNADQVADEMILNAPSGKDIVLMENAQSKFRISPSLATMENGILGFQIIPPGGGGWSLTKTFGTSAIYNAADGHQFNQNITFLDAIREIGSTVNPLNNLFLNTLRLQQGGTLVTNKSNIISNASDSMVLNVPTPNSIFMSYGGNTVHQFGSTSIITPNVIVDNTFTINNSGALPQAAGQFTRNGADIIVKSGGNNLNLSDLLANPLNQSLVSNGFAIFSNGGIFPDNPNTRPIGAPGFAFKDIYANNYHSDLGQDILFTSSGMFMQLGNNDFFQLDIDGGTVFQMTENLILLNKPLVLNNGVDINTGTGTGTMIGATNSQKIGFHGKPPSARPQVFGSRSSGSALTNLLAALDFKGIIENFTTP